MKLEILCLAPKGEKPDNNLLFIVLSQFLASHRRKFLANSAALHHSGVFLLKWILLHNMFYLCTPCTFVLNRHIRTYFRSSISYKSWQLAAFTVLKRILPTHPRDNWQFENFCKIRKGDKLPLLPSAFAFTLTCVMVNWFYIGSAIVRVNLFHQRTNMEILLSSFSLLSNTGNDWEDLLWACLCCSSLIGVTVIFSKQQDCLLPQPLWEKQVTGRRWVDSAS